jgi:predicted nucleic acid-binding protein
MIIVCDSSPLIALAICDKLDLLDTLFHEVVVPEQVYNEINAGGKPDQSKMAGWAQGKVEKAKNRQLFQAINLTLDAGESEAIALYWEKSADYLLIDEHRGRRIAAQNGITVIGTLGILLRAKEAGLLNAIKPLLDLLSGSPIHISDSLYRKALELAQE